MMIGDERFMMLVRRMAKNNDEFRTDFTDGGFHARIPMGELAKALMDKFFISRPTAYRWIQYRLSQRRGFWVRSVSLRLVQIGRGFTLCGIFKAKRPKR